jgi:hypothetical protein
MKRSAVSPLIAAVALLAVAVTPSLAAPGTSVKNVSVALSSDLANHVATYTVGFTTSESGALSTSDRIVLKFPSGTLPGDFCGDTASFTSNVEVNGSTTSVSTIVKCLELRVAVPVAIGASTAVTVELGSTTPVIRNPGAGSSYRIRVSTTRDARAVNTPKYTIVAQHAPVAGPVPLQTTDEDVAKVITLTGSDADDDALSFSIASLPAHGQLGSIGPADCSAVNTCSADVTYTPTGDYNGPDDFTFRVNDGVVSSAAATVSINVDQVNDAPVAVNDDATVDEDSVGNVIDVLANDSDVDVGDTLTITANSPATLGTASCGASSCTYDSPGGGFTGNDSFTYTISDGTTTDTATVNIEVMPAPPGGGGGTASFEICAKPNATWDLGPTDVPIWGFALGDCTGAGAATLPGPVLDMDVGDEVTITLDVDASMPAAVALELNGMDIFPDMTGTAPGTEKDYEFTASEPGTYIYGAADNRQTLMGLYGALIVRPSTPDQAYNSAASAYDVEEVLVLSEVDPDFNLAPTTFDLLDYAPTYWLINGEAYPDTKPIAASDGDKVLLRYVNAGAMHHTMSMLGTHQNLIGRDADPIRYPYEVVAETIPAGSTLDAIATPMTAGDYWLYNSQLHLDNAGSYPGGMLTRIVAT